MLNPPKSRELSVLQLFEILQEEYVVCMIRVMLYPLQKHKDYWQDTANKKKEKIIDIARKNQQLCIFDDANIYKRVKNKVIPEDCSYPTFFYKNDMQQLQQQKWDRHNYFLKDAEVEVFDENGTKYVGNILFVDFNKEVAKVKLESGQVNDFNFQYITRPILKTV